jgi:membrane associated rhomboid family serine protease
MGIYDREYYRREGPSFLGSFTERAHACKWLILINVVVFVLQLIIPQVTELGILNVQSVMSGEVWRLLTHAFLHSPDDPFHIIFNMLFLWFLGAEVEDLYGSREFLAMYLTAAVVGGVAHVITVLTGAVHDSVGCLGASGAVMAVMVVAAFHYPQRIVYVFFFPLRLWLIVVIYVSLNAYQFLTQTGGHTAVDVHLAGAGFGFLYYKFQWRILGFWEDIRSWFGTRRVRTRPRLRVYREEEPSTPVALAPAGPKLEVDEHLEAQVDAVLEKVSRHGQASLTDSEREILFRASEVYKKRRS